MLKDKGGLIPALILVIICSLSAALLSWTNVITEKSIDYQKQQKDELTRQSILKEAKNFEAIDLESFFSNHPNYSEEQAKINKKSKLLSIYKGVNENRIIGYIIEGAYRGYGGDVPVMVGILSNGTISSVKVLTNEETPGLGKKVEDEDFLKQFNGADVNKPFRIGEANQNETLLDTVSGATISSTAVKESVNLAMEIYPKFGGNTSNECT